MIITTKKMTHKKREYAQAMVEFAIVFPVLLLITYGIIEFGRMIFIYAAVTGAAREGARYGAAAGDIGDGTPHYSDCNGILAAVQRGAILNPINDVKIWYDRRPGPEGTPGPNLDPTQTIKLSCPPTDAHGDDMIGLGNRIGVSVVARYTPIIHFLGFNGFDIKSENARTILVRVNIPGTPPSPVPTSTRTNTPVPTDTPTVTPTQTPVPTKTPHPTKTPNH